MSKKQNVKVPEGIVDYYAVYAIDRKAKTKEIRKLLLQKQGELRSHMSNGSLNGDEVMEKLQDAYNMIAAAVKIFKNEDRRKEYDKQLDAAYATGKIDVEAQKAAQDIYEEIEAMFLKGNYRGAIRKCMEALNNNICDFRIYLLLAQSYFALHDTDHSLESVEDGLRVHPDNLPLLKAGSRFANEGKKDFNRAQRYVNRMMEIDPQSPLAISEQSYLYLNTGREDLAYQMIDDYMEKHPSDVQFRKDCAHDLIGHSYSYYTKDPSSEGYVIASEENYNKCLDICNKAAGIYNDENVRTALDTATSFGQTVFNDENLEGILWLLIGGLVYAIVGLVLAGSGFSTIGQAGILALFIGALMSSPVLLIGILLLFCAWRLREVSYRPYWQIYKFIITGEREKKEKNIY
ncbi:MAG: hypothetical protein LUI14_13190 [Lachnospiraceae bacterium]|nr:hypothetical protein [Lachnospiraceae bacterium]